ncbi:hypothetical protein EJ03DRAFT_350151 [Teratosphaeria nubilosa]|uniref:Uncharacterized protein n=1 Tax=Teratosphaeria nubilosa TaxID=161662 RepID=A0A6G1LFC4_9PEZI|nr:hypothetical protein EJ03DRAFT_350151 [Teratosphaeria nubilosa]
MEKKICVHRYVAGMPLVWKIVIGVGGTLLMVQVFAARKPLQGVNDLSAPVNIPIDAQVNTNPGWQYDWKRDHANYGLSSEQCDAASPDLYSEIDRAAAVWKAKKMTPSSIEFPAIEDQGYKVMGATCRLVKGQLFIVRTRGWRDGGDTRRRLVGALNQIHRALVGALGVGEIFDDVEFTVVLDDKPSWPRDSADRAFWVFTKPTRAGLQTDSTWVVPDFVSRPFSVLIHAGARH